MKWCASRNVNINAVGHAQSGDAEENRDEFNCILKQNYELGTKLKTYFYAHFIASTTVNPRFEFRLRNRGQRYVRTSSYYLNGKSKFSISIISTSYITI